MAIIGSIDIGDGKVQVVVDHDPTAVSTNVLTGSIIIEQSTQKTYMKTDDGDTTNVKIVWDSAGVLYAGANNTPLNDVENIKSNLTANVAPTVNDDVDLGYAIGSHWIDTVTDRAYICLDATDGAAVWTEIANAGVSFEMNGVEVNTNSTGFIEVMRFTINLNTVFGSGDFKLQANAWMSTAITGEVRLFNITDAVQVTNALISITGTIPGVVETVSASTPTNAEKEYALEFRRITGTGGNSITLRGSILKRV